MLSKGNHCFFFGLFAVVVVVVVVVVVETAAAATAGAAVPSVVASLDGDVIVLVSFFRCLFFATFLFFLWLARLIFLRVLVLFLFLLKISRFHTILDEKLATTIDIISSFCRIVDGVTTDNNRSQQQVLRMIYIPAEIKTSRLVLITIRIINETRKYQATAF